MLNKIREVSFRANIGSLWNVKTWGTPVQLALLMVNFILREEHGCCCDLDNAPDACYLFSSYVAMGGELDGDRGIERSGKLRTSKKHPRNMHATCLLLRHCQGDDMGLPRPCGYVSGGGTSAQVRLSASFRPLTTCRVQMKTREWGGGWPNFLT